MVSVLRVCKSIMFNDLIEVGELVFVETIINTYNKIPGVHKWLCD